MSKRDLVKWFFAPRHGNTNTIDVLEHFLFAPSAPDETVIASEGSRGAIYRDEGATGEADALWWVRKNAADAMEIVELARRDEFGRTRFDVRDYGARSDGVLDGTGTNDYAAVVATIAAAQAQLTAGTIKAAEIWFPSGGTVIAPGSGQNISITGSNIHLRGATGAYIDLTQVPTTSNRTIFSFSGTTGTVHALSANGDKRASSVSCASAASYASGDMVLIKSDGRWDPSQDNARTGEINFVFSVSGTTINLMQPLEDDYTTADAATIAKITPARNISVAGLHFIGTPGSHTTENSRAQCVHFDRCENVWLTENTFEHVRHGTRITNTVNSRVVNNTFQHFHQGTPSPQMYAVAVMDATQECLIANNTFWDLRNALSTNNTGNGGIPRRILIANNTCLNPSGVTDEEELRDSGNFSTHSSCDQVWIMGNLVMGSSGNAVQYSGTNGVVTGNTFIGCSWNRTTTPVIHVHSETNRLASTIVANNYIRGGRSPGISINTGTPEPVEPLHAVVCSNNEVLDIDASSSISITGNANGTLSNVLVEGNLVKPISGIGINLATIDQGIVNSNLIKLATDVKAIKLNNCNFFTLNGNEMELPSAATSNAAGISIEADPGASTNIVVGAGNLVKSPSAAGSRGVFIDPDVAKVTVGPANDFTDCTTPVSSTTGTIHNLFTRTSIAATIASGAIVIPDPNVIRVRVDTESSAASDDLDTITAPTFGTKIGQLIVLESTNNSRDVTVRDGAGNVSLQGPCTLATTDAKLFLEWDGTNWVEVGRTSDTGVVDSAFYVFDNSDATKKFAIQASGITTGTTRTMTVPDADFTPSVSTHVHHKQVLITAAATITNIPLAATEFAGGTNTTRITTDLTNYSQVRLIGYVTVVGNAGSKVYLEYATTFGGAYADIGTSQVVVAVDALDVFDSGWITLAAGAKTADIWMRLMSVDGDGAADPVVRQVYAHFK